VPQEGRVYTFDGLNTINVRMIFICSRPINKAFVKHKWETHFYTALSPD